MVPDQTPSPTGGLANLRSDNRRLPRQPSLKAPRETGTSDQDQASNSDRPKAALCASPHSRRPPSSAPKSASRRRDLLPQRSSRGASSHPDRRPLVWRPALPLHLTN